MPSKKRKEKKRKEKKLRKKRKEKETKRNKERNKERKKGEIYYKKASLARAVPLPTTSPFLNRERAKRVIPTD